MKEEEEEEEEGGEENDDDDAVSHASRRRHQRATSPLLPRPASCSTRILLPAAVQQHPASGSGRPRSLPRRVYAYATDLDTVRVFLTDPREVSFRPTFRTTKI